MKFTTPCFVRVEDAEKRKELTEWLKGIGYYVCSCCLFDGCNTLHCRGIDRLKIAYEVHGICDYDEETRYSIGQFKAENAESRNPSYDCGLYAPIGSFEKCLLEHRVGIPARKATVEEIIEHFKKREK